MDSTKYQINEVNAWNGWDQLKQVVLGNCYEPEFFEDLGDHKLRDLLQQILYETHEDLTGIKNTLEKLGVEVIQAPRNAISELSNDVVSNNICDSNEVQGIPKPCLTPRDHYITLGNKLLFTALHRQETRDGTMFNPDCMDMFFQEQWDLYQDGKISQGPINYTFESKHPIREKFMFPAPTIHRVGNKLIIDQQDWSNISDIILKRYPEFTGANIAVGGHTDGSMNLPKPGLVVCAPWMGPKDFKDTLPGWDVCVIKDPHYMKGDIGSWEKESHITKGKWWHPEAKSNPELVNFVEDWLTNWVGFAEESVFEVNMLSVNQSTILSSNHQPEVHKELEKHGIEPIYCRFRHRNFWDGGLHCLTLDTVREGGQEDYGV